MLKKAFIFFLFYSISLFGDAPLSLQKMSHSPTEIPPKTTCTIAFSLTNNTMNSLDLEKKITIPDNWQLVSKKEDQITLSPEEERLDVIAFFVPSNTPAGTYQIHYQAGVQACVSHKLRSGEGQTVILDESKLFDGKVCKPCQENVLCSDEMTDDAVHPDVCEKCRLQETLEIKILPVHHIDINTNNDSKKNYSNVIAEYELTLSNLGNVTEETDLEVNNPHKLNYTFEPKMPFLLEPGEQRTIKMRVQAKDTIYAPRKYFISVKLSSDQIDAPSTNFYLHAFPKKIKKAARKKEDLYHLETGFIGGIERGKKEILLNQWGSGYIDEKKQKKLNFLFRVPLVEQRDIYRSFGGTPKEYYLNYIQPGLDFYIGDNFYKLSPLTFNQFGRGGHAKVFPNRFEIGGIYVKDTFASPQNSAAAYIAYHPDAPWRISGNFLRTEGKPLSNSPYVSTIDANTYSIYVNSDKKLHMDLEVATSHHSNHSNLDHAVFFTSTGKLFSDRAWFTFQQIYAEPHFAGYYRDYSQTNASISFPISKASVNSNFQIYRTNLKSSSSKKSAPRNITGSTQISYAFPFGLWSSFSYNIYRSKDALTNDGYLTQFGRLNLSQSLNNWSFMASAELGGYKNFTPTYQRRLWENYSINVSYRPKAGHRYSIYSKWGLPEISSDVIWAQTYGASASWSIQRKMHLMLLYEYSHRSSRYRRNFLSGRFYYQFKNSHTLEIKGNFSNRFGERGLWKSLSEEFHLHNDYKFLLSYIIPWNVPITKSKTSRIQGNAYKLEENKKIPLTNQIVKCGAQSALSDDKGRFVFEDLHPETTDLALEEYIPDWVSSKPSPLSIALSQGEKKKMDIIYVKPSKCSGQIALYTLYSDTQDEDISLDELLTDSNLIKKEQQSEEKEYKKVKGWEYVRIKLFSEDGLELHETITDAHGLFSFDRLRPGKWNIYFETENIPSFHYLEKKMLSFELVPEEDKQLEIKILPTVRIFKETKTLKN